MATSRPALWGRGTILISTADSRQIRLLPRADRRLLDDSRRTAVWPDSLQVSGGKLIMRLPTRPWVWLTFGLRPVGHRDEAWLKKGLPCS